MNNVEFILEELTFVPIGHHRPMHIRPYSMNVNQDAVETITTALAMDQSGVVRPDMISSISDEIIAPSAVPIPSRINQEWVTTKRYAFILKVRTVSALKGVTITYIQGYTDHDGVNMFGTANPDMMLNINSVIGTSLDEFHTPMGIHRKERLRERYNVMTAGFEETSFTQRPRDIMEAASTDDLKTMLGGGQDFEVMVADDGSDDFYGQNTSHLNMGDMYEPKYGLDPGTWDTGIQFETFSASNYLDPFGSKNISSTIENIVPSTFLTRTLTAGLLSSKNREISIGDAPIETSSGTGGLLGEPDLSNNRFIRYYTRRFRGGAMAATSLRYGDLFELDPTIEDRFTLVKLNKNFVDPILGNTPETGDHWDGKDILTIKAYSIIEAAASLAMQNGFNRMVFGVSNVSNPRGTTEFAITDWKSFIQLNDKDMLYLVEYFKNEFEATVFIPETKGGVVPMTLEVYVDILGTSKVYIEYSTFQGNWYTAPTIANSAYAPVLSPTQDNVDMLGASFNILVSEVSNADFMQRRTIY